MRDLLRAWRSFRARPTADQARLVRLVMEHARQHGVAAAIDRVRHGGAVTVLHDGYADWWQRHTPDATRLELMRDEALRLAYQPLITIITPVYNTDPQWLDACADSVLAQAYPRWQWSIGNDGSTKPGTLDALTRIAARDPRIVVSHAEKNGGIAAASNLALSKAEGEYVALMDSDDALLPHALYRMVSHLNQPGERADVLYSDEDKLDLDGTRCEAYFKPDWSPDLFLSNMFVCHLLMARRSLIHEVGAFRTAFDFSQDYDLMLRLSERANRIDHVADILYHWRKVPLSGATMGDAKPAAHIAGRAALQDALTRRGVAGEVEDIGPAGFYRVRYRLTTQPLVSLIVGGETPERAAARLGPITGWPHTEYVAAPDQARGEYLVFLAASVTPSQPDWLASLLELAVQPGVGAAAPRVLEPGGAIREQGLVLGAGTLASRALAGLPATHPGYFGSAIAIRNVSAVSGSCFVTPRTLWDEMGGWDATLRGGDAQAIDYCLRVRTAGYRVVVTPWAVLTDSERGGGRVPLATGDDRRLRDWWGPAIATDPFHNPHLPATGLYPTS
jgi:O-antigen biosynthesis protein